MRIRVAGAQIPVGSDVPRNVEAIGRAIEFAAEREADVLLTPEGSLSGYTPRFDADEVAGALDDVVALARARGVGLALGTCFREPDDGRIFNELRFYAADGSFLGCHTKTLRCGSMTDPTKGEINDYAALPLRTFAINGVVAGGLICNDLWANPACTPMPDTHLTQQLARQGARVVFHAVNGGRDGSEWSQVTRAYHESNLRMRARAGCLWIVTVDNCSPACLPCSSPGGVVAPDGSWAVRTPEAGEQFFCHTIEDDEP